MEHQVSDSNKNGSLNEDMHDKLYFESPSNSANIIPEDYQEIGKSRYN